jgi:acetoin utilization protein AcuB
MLVGERMSQPIITVPPNLPISEALNLMRKERIRRTPVVDDGKLVGIITDHDLLNASPSPATSLSIWEMTYLLSKITVADVMTKQVLTIRADTPIEEAARIMADNKIGGLPVMENDTVVGIITETDIFKLFLELMGARDPGVRVTALILEKPGGLAKLSKSITDIGGNFVAFGIFAGKDTSNREITFKVTGVGQDDLRKAILPYIQELKDIRESKV